MIKHIVLLAPLMLPTAVLSQAMDCSNPMTQSAMNACAYQDWSEADDELNATYKWAMTVARGWSEGAATALRDAQRTWIPYRDAACEAEGYLFEGGSMAPLIVSTCKAELTRRRTEDLRAVYDTN